MATEMRRLTISIPEDIANELDDVKRRSFVNAPKSKVIWHILRLGLEVDKETSEAG